MSVRVTVAIAAAGEQVVVELELEAGATVAEALAAARVAERLPGWKADSPVGIWSRRCELATVLRDGDRVEAYRPLQADPKQMRRARARLRPSSTRSRSGR